LGGNRWRLLGEDLTESFLLSTTGGGFGLLMAYVVVQWFVRTRQDISRTDAIHIDGMVVVFAIGLIFLCALSAGVISSLSTANNQIFPSLQESSRSHSMEQRGVTLRKWLLSVEVGLTSSCSSVQVCC
jgi:ABC-type antimicrobial peptide transport system permease subunit